MSAWWQYVQRVAGTNALQKDIAKTAGVDATTVNRWAKEGTRPQADHVVKFARNYKQSVIEALIIAGYLTGDDVDNDVITLNDRSELSALDLLDELRGRLVDRGRSSTSELDNLGDRIIDDVVPPVEDGLKKGREGA